MKVMKRHKARYADSPETQLTPRSMIVIGLSAIGLINNAYVIYLFLVHSYRIDIFVKIVLSSCDLIKFMIVTMKNNETEF
ncbi:hypothetical protein AYI96_06505 [Shewanella sp. MSW]|nr:hypothetical protein AYI96_06505 [Shewanella sp. MSW]